MNLRLPALLVLNILYFQTSFSQIVINEISSRGNIYNEDGLPSDWIELYNNGTTSVDLMNYGLSDDATDLSKWKFPSLTILPGDYIVVLADGSGIVNTTNHWESAVLSDEIWKYFIGSSEPPATWKDLSFDDAAWSSGTGGIGYGDGDDGTAITATTSVYLRKTFTADDTSAIGKAFLHMDYDDAFVAYLNGTEIARSANIDGAPPAHDAVAVFDHEANMYTGGSAEAFTIDEAFLKTILKPGNNVLCIQVHNTSLGSSDLSSNAWLSFGIKTSATYFSPVPVWFPVTAAYNHTSFSLSTEGETIYLSNSTGDIIDQKNYGYLEAYFSLCRKPNGSDTWCNTSEPTPAYTNNFSVCYDGFEPDPVLSLTPGFYSGPQTISMSSTSPTAVIHYTLDGSFVRESSPVYSTPLTIDTTSVISAKCFSSSTKLPSHIIKNTYFLDQPDYSLPVISISADPGSFFDTDTGIYVFGPPDYSTDYPYYGANFWEPWERLAHISYFDAEGVQQFAKRMDIEIHGGWSRAMDQRSFRLDFKSELDGAVDYQLFPDDKPDVTHFNNFNLRNSGQHVDATRLQDAFIARSMSTTHLDYEAYHPCVVYVNGNYWGLYEIREKADEHYVESNYGIDANTIDMRNGWNTLAGSDTGFTNLYNWVMTNDPFSDTFYDELSKQLNIENYTDYYIAEIYYQNVDFGGYYWGINNIKLWQENTAAGKWNHLMYDMDGALGWFGESVYTNYIDFTRSPASPSYNSQMFDRILYNTQFRNYFINRSADLINTIFQMDKLEAIEEPMEDEIEPEMDRQIDRWGLPYTYGYWQSTLNDMMDYAESRISPARTQIRTSFSLPAIRDVDLDVYPPGAGHIKISTIYPGPLPWTGKYFDAVPVQITAIANPGYTFNNWSANDILPSGSSSAFVEVTLTSSETFTANFTGSAVTPDIIVSELNYHSDKTLDAGDWVEFYNKDAIAYDMSGWKLFDATNINSYTLPEGTIIEPGQYFVIAEDTAKFASVYPAYGLVSGGFPFTFSDAGDAVILKDLDNNTILNFQYADSLAWPKGADGTGRTLEILNYDEDMNTAENWFDGCMLGSPGSAYTPCNDAVVFSEINYNSAASLNAGDWIEILNTTTADLDISGWQFVDDNDTLVYHFPAGSILTSDERTVIANDLTAFSDRHPALSGIAGPFHFGLDASGEELRLFNSKGVLQLSVIYSDKSPWPSEPDGDGETLELTDIHGQMNTAENWFAGCPEGSPAMPYDADCTLDIPQVELLPDLNIYPDPADEYFTVNLSVTYEQLQHAELSLYDASGKMLHSYSGLENNFIIRRNGEASGVYYLKLVVDDHTAVREIILL